MTITAKLLTGFLYGLAMRAPRIVPFYGGITPGVTPCTHQPALA